MNERIKALIKESDLEECIDDAYLLRDDWNPFIEKFAGLIVQECIWQLECAKQGDSFTGETYDNEVNDVLTDQIDNLKEHFGVYR